MEIINTNVKRVNVSKMSRDEFQTYWRTIESDSLHQVLPSRLNLGYLCEVIEGIEKVEGNFQETWDNKPQYPYFADLDWDAMNEAKKLTEMFNSVHTHYEWMASDQGFYAHSFKDVTMIYSFYEAKDKSNPTYDLYHTPEVLQVLKQWKAYLEKFEAENKASHE